ncbi:A24 family peptidase [Desulforamulus reducens]|nr:A24 family peptidase [Desulforamulus reducens]
MIVIFSLALTAYIDIKKREIPHISVILLLCLGIYLHWQEPLFFLIGIFSMFIPLLLFSLVTGSLGEGDIKLFAVMGGIMGIMDCLLFFGIVNLTSIAGELLYRAYKGELRKIMVQQKELALSFINGTSKSFIEQVKPEDTVPLGAYFLPGYLIYYMGVIYGVF